MELAESDALFRSIDYGAQSEMATRLSLPELPESCTLRDLRDSVVQAAKNASLIMPTVPANELVLRVRRGCRQQMCAVGADVCGFSVSPVEQICSNLSVVDDSDLPVKYLPLLVSEFDIRFTSGALDVEVFKRRDQFTFQVCSRCARRHCVLCGCWCQASPLGCSRDKHASRTNFCTRSWSCLRCTRAGAMRGERACGRDLCAEPYVVIASCAPVVWSSSRVTSAWERATC